MIYRPILAQPQSQKPQKLGPRTTDTNYLLLTRYNKKQMKQKKNLFCSCLTFRCLAKILSEILYLVEEFNFHSGSRCIL